MTFSQVLYEYLVAAFTVDDVPTIKLEYMSALNAGNASDYYVMFLVSNPEDPVSFCDEAGDSGTSLVQFSYYGPGGPDAAMSKLETLKEKVVSILGDIDYNGSSFNVWQNRTSGVKPIGGVALNTWDAVFESQLSWTKNKGD